jgi:CRISPR-associated protein Cas2
MWLLVLFDLPTATKEERKSAARFRSFLLKDGYAMVQFSVYARICRGHDRTEKHFGRLCARLPAKGSVRALRITDRQYERMDALVGEKTEAEKKGGEQLLLF